MINKSCCPEPTNKKKVIINSNQTVIPQNTQVNLAVNAILFSLGGRTQYGFRQPNRPLRFLGRTEGQNGGILGPLKNSF
jgi:hypothetical protein